jgi:single-strand DNA-binding protein
MATNEKKRDKGGDFQDVTTWFKITLWGKQAENASKYLTKGSPVYIEGRLRVEEWADRDGKSRYTLDVQASDMQFLSGGAGSSRTDEYSGSPSGDSSNDFADEPGGSGADGNSSTPTDDDIPF